MEEVKSTLKECSIHDIYCKNQGSKITYKIPIYQRNYAWGRDEIEALIKDVHDSMDKSVYYIGTLVTFKSDDAVYEVIDGQQRLTTIYIILKALDEKEICNELTYSARKVSANTIKDLSSKAEETDEAISNGFEYAKAIIADVIGEKEKDKENFKKFFLHNVKIIHYRVPKDVDLNHYFEVMNSRGEQLEKHEIVKAKMCEQLAGNDADMAKFSRIWEACSDMSFYVQQKLPEMNAVFGKNMNGFEIDNFNDFPTSMEDTAGVFRQKTIAELLNATTQKTEKEETDDKNDRFQAIIDFPNLLLIVLKITRLRNEDDFKPQEFTLDDKELIKAFRKVELTPEFVKGFAYNLLKAKFFLDNYVIHHTNAEDTANENPWKLQTYYRKERRVIYLKDLDSNKMQQEEMVQLLSMFEVAFTPKNRKNYLFYCLLHLFEDHELDNYVTFLRKLADKYFFDVYLDNDKLSDKKVPKPNSFDETILRQGKLYVDLDVRNVDFKNVYPNGSEKIPLYVFNYTDYKLWEKYAVELRGKNSKKTSPDRIAFFNSLGCTDFGVEIFDNFYFSRTRKSLEHYYPQAKAGEKEAITKEEINCFGNFAMIGSDANSSGSNWNPMDKKNRYLDKKLNQVSIASLKFRIMLQICQDNYDTGIKEDNKREFGLEWNAEDMKKHQQQMLEIVMRQGEKQ